MRYMFLKIALNVSLFITLAGIIYGCVVFYVSFDDFDGTFEKDEAIEGFFVASLCLVIFGGLFFLSVGVSHLLRQLELLRNRRAGIFAEKKDKASLLLTPPKVL